MREEIRLVRRGQIVRLQGFEPTATLLDHLRLVERATGTKEGCAEGDCGACTVVLRQAQDGKVVYRPVNACIALLGQCDGSEVITVEDLAGAGELHPVQQALVDYHGSQCGFCTPGFVMAIFALYQASRGRPPDRAGVNAWLAGNLCRCTGYRPIVDAALSSCANGPNDTFLTGEDAAFLQLARLADREDVLVGSESCFFAAPVSVSSLLQLLQAHPDATLVAGATDVGLWVTKQLRTLPKIVWLGRVQELTGIEASPEAVTFGAAVTLERASGELARIDPDLGELIGRFAGVQVRGMGTVGGNIANGSPIGDLPPALIALGSTLVLQKGEHRRLLPLEDFFLAYGRQDREPGEFVFSVRVPRLRYGEHFRCYKVSKRIDQDISAVMGAFKIAVDGARIGAARVAFGGMAGIPQRAPATEAALVGARLDRPDTWHSALAALPGDFRPIDDHRASAQYRIDVARALLRRALAEMAGARTAETRVAGRREDAHVGTR